LRNRVEAHGAVHYVSARRADTAQGAARGRARKVVGHIAGRPFGRPTTQAKEFARLAALLNRLARLQKCAQVRTADEKGTPDVRRLKSGRDPSSNRKLMHPQKSGDFGYVIVEMDFDAAAIEPLRHGLRHALDEIADVLDLPGRRARPELHLLGEERAERREDGIEAQKTGSRKVVPHLLCVVFCLSDVFHINPMVPEKGLRRRRFT